MFWCQLLAPQSLGAQVWLLSVCIDLAFLELSFLDLGYTAYLFLATREELSTCALTSRKPLCCKYPTGRFPWVCLCPTSFGGGQGAGLKLHQTIKLMLTVLVYFLGIAWCHVHPALLVMCAFLKLVFLKDFWVEMEVSLSSLYMTNVHGHYTVLQWQFLIFSESHLSWDKVACNIITNHVFLKYGNWSIELSHTVTASSWGQSASREGSHLILLRLCRAVG